MTPLTIVQGSPRARTVRAGVLLAVAVALFVLPIISGRAAQIDRWSEIAAYAVAILGLGLVTGYCGQISIGHSVFVGIGGYTTVLLVADHHWPYLATIPVAVGVCFLAGAIVGVPALRISGLYLVTVTLAIAAAFPTLIDRFESFTGGPNGKVAPSMRAPGWVPIDMNSLNGPSTFHYYVIVGIAALMFLSAWLLVRSRIGRAWVAVRESPYSAAATGVNVSHYKVYAFAISAAFAGVAGSLLTIETPQVADVRFDLYLSIFLLVGLIAGGRTSIWGAIPGALIFVILRSYLATWFDELSISNGSVNDAQLVGVISGALLIAFAFLLPGGVIEGIKNLVRPYLHVIHRPVDGWEQFRLEPLTDESTPSGMSPSSPVSHPSGLPD